MLVFDTTRFGKLTCDQTEIISFVRSLPGLEPLTSFVLVDYQPSEPFLWLQSIKDPKIALPILEPQWVRREYKLLEVLNSQFLMKELLTDNLKDLNLYCVVTIPKDPKKMTINLRAPLLVNTEKGTGYQYIIPEGEEDYPVREMLYPKIKGAYAGAKTKTRKRKVTRDYPATVVRV